MAAMVLVRCYMAERRRPFAPLGGSAVLLCLTPSLSAIVDAAIPMTISHKISRVRRAVRIRLRGKYVAATRCDCARALMSNSGARQKPPPQTNKHNREKKTQIQTPRAL